MHSPSGTSLESHFGTATPASLWQGMEGAEFSAHAVFWIRPDGRIEYANDKACVSLGYTRAEMAGKSVFEFDPAYPRSLWTRRWREAKQSGRLKTDSVHHRKDGSTFPVEIHSTFVELDGLEFLCSSAVDVTEMKQRETEMRRQNEEIQSVLDALPALVWFKDANNRILKVNRSVADVMGLAIHEIEGRRVEELFPDQAESYFRQDREVIQSRTRTLGIIERYQLGDGPPRWYRTDKIPTFNDHGEVSGIIVVSTDVTEMKEQEQQLRDSEQRYGRAVEGSTDGLWEWEVGSDHVFYAPRFARLLGYEPEKFGNTLGAFNEHLHPDDHERVWDEVQRNLDHESHYDIRYRLRTKQGNYRWFRARGTTTRDSDHKPVIMSGSIQDIDELVRTEDALKAVHRDLEDRFQEKTEQLRRSESKYQDLYNRSPEMHASVDPRTRKIVECNETLADALGYAKADLVGVDLFDLYHLDCRDAAMQAFREFKRTGEVAEMELILRRNDGTPLPVSLRVTSVRDEQGRVLFSRSSWRDITQRKVAENLLEQREEELAHVARLATMGEMAAGLAHELNQPLYSIANYARGCILRMDSETIDKAQLREIAEEVASEAERAGEIIRRLRRMVQKREPIESEIEINLVLRDACQLLDAELRRQSVEIEVDLDASNPRCCSDDIQLQQVIVNLVRNAVEAMKKTPIGQRTIRASTEVSDGEILVSIEDNGCGFDDNEEERIFDAFHTTSETGMGMGLAISRSIIERHGGRIWARRNSHGGATFQFTLPLLTKEAIS